MNAGETKAVVTSLEDVEAPAVVETTLKEVSQVNPGVFGGVKTQS